MNAKTIRALIDAGAIKRSRIVARGTRFHVEFDTATGSITALTHRASTKEWATLDAAARWLRELGIGSFHVDLALWTPGQKRLAL